MCTGQPAISHKSNTRAALQDLILDKIRRNCKTRGGKKSLSAKRCISYEHHATRGESQTLHQELLSLYCFNLGMSQSKTTLVQNDHYFLL